MAQRIVLLIEGSSGRKSHHKKYQIFLLLLSFAASLWILSKWSNEHENFVVHLYTLFVLDETIIGVIITTGVCLAAFMLVYPKRSEKVDEFVLSVYPTGIQISSSSMKRKETRFIPRECVLDCRVKEVILVNRVYSSPQLLIEGTSGSEEIELFPEIELSFIECSSICRKLRELLK